MDSSTDDAARTPRSGAASLRRLALIGTTALALLATAAPIAAAQGSTTAQSSAGSQSAGAAAPHDAVPPVATPTLPAKLPAQPGTFVRTNLTRLLDTRSATGVPTATPLGPDGNLSFSLGLPAADVKAVVLNVTATDTTADGFLTAYPDGAQQPSTSNLNFTAGQTVANLVTVPVTDGKVDIHNRFGSVDVIADMSGYYTDNAALAGSTYLPVTPGRVLDTRDGLGVPQGGPIGQFGTINVPVAGQGGVPQYGATSVVLNVTATDTTDAGFLTVYPHGTARPGTSNLNFAAHQTVPNLVTVPLGADGSVDIYNHLGTTDVVADVFGFYTAAPTGSGYTATGPTRLFDTREAGGHKVGPGQTLSRPVALGSGLGSTKVSAVVLNVTATGPTSDGFLTVFTGAGSTPPGTSNLNFTAGQTVPNLVIVPVDDSGMLNFYNRFGSVDLVVDLFGYFTAPQGGPTAISSSVHNYADPFTKACSTVSPGPWLGRGYFGVVTLSATGVSLPNPGATTPWTEMVLTGPDDTLAYQGSAASNSSQPSTVNVGQLKAGSYSWYAYATDGKQVSAPSQPCYFQVWTDSSGPRVFITSNGSPGPIVVGQQVTFTFSAGGGDPNAPDSVASFCYAMDYGPCTQIAPVFGAVNGIGGVTGYNSVTLTMGNWGSHTFTVQATTVAGFVDAPTPYGFYVRSQ
ncbi:hypothetical protein P3T37_007069 [Kitasatospora sp. MAA4]|uniref:hypothetical protein n=1 Tax=Kitasatospora sp. MAA4 TaxID=3035093 RepID=UPI0024742562|nr:hypothetical protein [Kitasatospora sp. MAA4]MDH6137636.1 hypothetical protein [Kitasatospora sp. MAA4]